MVQGQLQNSLRDLTYNLFLGYLHDLSSEFPAVLISDEKDLSKGAFTKHLLDGILTQLFLHEPMNGNKILVEC